MKNKIILIYKLSIIFLAFWHIIYFFFTWDTNAWITWIILYLFMNSNNEM